MPLLSYLDDNDLYEHVGWVLSLVEKTSENEFYKNAVDPFSAIFEASIQEVPSSKWVELEKVRQGQKSMQNRLGDFHQRVLGSIHGWKNLGTGQLVDIENEGNKIIAEIKNKHNTTKGSDKIVIYDNLKFALDTKYTSYMSYYVEIIPRARKIYDKPFTPSDNKLHKRRPPYHKIHCIDGKSFYELATGEKDALRMLYDVLPKVIGNILKKPTESIVKDPFYKELYEKTFSS